MERSCFHAGTRSILDEEFSEQDWKKPTPSTSLLLRMKMVHGRSVNNFKILGIFKWGMYAVNWNSPVHATSAFSLSSIRSGSVAMLISPKQPSHEGAQFIWIYRHGNPLCSASRGTGNPCGCSKKRSVGQKKIKLFQD